MMSPSRICEKVAEYLRLWKNDDAPEYDDIETLLAIDNLLEQQGYDVGEPPDSWDTW